MQILLANAKIMFDKADRAAVSKPLFSLWQKCWLQKWLSWT